MTVEEYQPVWQTWNLVHTTRGPSVGADDASKTSGATRTSSGIDLRQSVQRARIQRRWSIDVLASHVKCDAKLLAAFEREAEVLPQEVLERLRKCLRIDSDLT